MALDFLARREHSEHELRQKLKSRDHDSDAVDAVLQQLKDERLQSDERFTESYVNHRFNAGSGPLKIRHELRQRGMLLGNASQLVDQLGELAEAGVQRVMLQWLDLEDIEGLEEIASSVMPQLD